MTEKKSAAPRRTAEEEVARNYWLLHASEAVFCAHTLSEAAATLSRFFPGQEDAANEALLQDLQSKGFPTTLEALDSQFLDLRSNHAGFWSGQYLLKDSAGRCHELGITFEEITLVLDGGLGTLDAASGSGVFSGQVLTLESSTAVLKVRFSAAALDGIENDASIDPARTSAHDLTLVQGTLVLGVGAARQEFQVAGKRGISTPEGIDHPQQGDPLSTWVGRYALRFASDDTWDFTDDILVGEDAQGPWLQFGESRATNVTFGNNALTAVLPGGVEFAARFDCAKTGVGRRFHAAFRAQGLTRGALGYARDRKPTRASARPWAAGLARRTRTVLAAADKPFDFCAVPYDFKIDSQDLKPSSGAVDVSSVGLDKGKFRLAADTQGQYWEWTVPSGQTWAAGSWEAFQPLGADMNPVAGARNAVLGWRLRAGYELQSLVETDYYENRLSFVNLDKVDAAGFDIALAQDDTNQPRLFAFDAAGVEKCPDGTPGAAAAGEEGRTVADWRLATVLIRLASGETQVAGFHVYALSLLPRTLAKRITARRRLVHEDGSPVTADDQGKDVDVPILVQLTVKMDSSDALELSGTEWPPVVLERPYSARMAASFGFQPYAWSVVRDEKPTNLIWDANRTDITFGLSGTPTGAAGQTFAPVIEVRSAPRAITRPRRQTVFVSTVLPSTEAPQLRDWTTWLATLIGVLPLAVGVIFYIHRKRNKKKLEQKEVEMVEKTAKAQGQALGEAIADAFTLRVEELHKQRVDVLKGQIRTFRDIEKLYEDAATQVQALITAENEQGDAKDEGKLRDLDAKLKHLDAMREEARKSKDAHKKERDKVEAIEEHK